MKMVLSYKINRLRRKILYRLFSQHGKTDLERLKKTMNRVLIIQLQYLGDSLIFTPVIRLLAERYPHIKIDLLASPTSYMVYRNNPFIDKIYTINGWYYKKGGVDIFEVMNTIREVRANRKQYDCCILDAAQTAFIFSFIAFMTRIKDRLGFCIGGNSFLNTYQIYSEYCPDTNLLAYNCKLAELLGVENGGDYAGVDLHYTLEHQKRVNELLGLELNSVKKIIGINPFTAKETTTWPIFRFRELIERIAHTFDVKIAVIGDKENQKYKDEFRFTEGGRVIDAIGLLELEEIAYLISKLDLFITLDTGPMHLCTQVRTKTICLVGGGDAGLWTYDYPGYHIIRHKIEECSPCVSINCRNKKHFKKCMDLITVEEVFEKVKETL
jgi:ADP-heptose:LPS heptosyltransferase